MNNLTLGLTCWSNLFVQDIFVKFQMEMLGLCSVHSKERQEGW